MMMHLEHPPSPTYFYINQPHVLKKVGTMTYTSKRTPFNIAYERYWSTKRNTKSDTTYFNCWIITCLHKGRILQDLMVQICRFTNCVPTEHTQIYVCARLKALFLVIIPTFGD